MKTTTITVTLQLEISDLPGCTTLIGDPLLRRLEMNIEGTVDGTLRAAGVNCANVAATVRRKEGAES